MSLHDFNEMKARLMEKFLRDEIDKATHDEMLARIEALEASEATASAPPPTDPQAGSSTQHQKSDPTHKSLSEETAEQQALETDEQPARTTGAQSAPIPAAEDPYLTRAPALVAGMHLGNYRLEKVVGEGGMGVVWQAEDLVGERSVVLKFVPPEVNNHEIEMEQVRSTFKSVQALQHQHVCPTYSLGQDEKLGYYLVMKYVEGVTLLEYRQRYFQQHHAFPLSEVIRLIQPIANALDYAHVNKVVHRDIKPGNIMVSEDGKDVQVIDFGLAAQFQTSRNRVTNAPRSISGTPPYMAPEQFRGQPQDGKTDQYSLAVVVYELLAGRPPFEGDWQTIRECVLREPIPAIEGQPAHVHEALSKAMAKSATDRFAGCSAFVEALRGEAEITQKTTESLPRSGPLEEVDRELQKLQFAGELFAPMCQVIQLAIHFGAGIYNRASEDPANATEYYATCARIYHHATTQVLARIEKESVVADRTLGESVAIKGLEHALNFSATIDPHNASDFAWALREGFDLCLALIQIEQVFVELEQKRHRLLMDHAKSLITFVLETTQGPLKHGRFVYGSGKLMLYLGSKFKQLADPGHVDTKAKRAIEALIPTLDQHSLAADDYTTDEVVELFQAFHQMLESGTVDVSQLKRELKRVQNALHELDQLKRAHERGLHDLKLEKARLGSRALPSLEDEIEEHERELEVVIPKQEEELEARARELEKTLRDLEE